MKKVFITFGARSKAYHNASRRLSCQAEDINVFDEVYAYNGDELMSDPLFWTRHSKFICRHRCGHGYWLWKPYIIIKHLHSLKEGDILVYTDAGSEIHPESGKTMQYMIDVAHESKKIVGSGTNIEKKFSKMDLILALDANHPKYLDCGQNCGGAILFIKTKPIMDLVETWYKIGCNYHMIDDSPSVAPNLSCFEAHRHDQSIFSLLTKTRDLINKNVDIRLSRAILTYRNKTGKSIITGKTYEW